MCHKEHEEDNELMVLEQKYEEILSAEPKSNAFCQLADVLCKQGKVDKAIGVLIRGLSHNKNNVTARFLLGKIYYDRWLIEQAKKEMERVLELTPDNLQAARLLSQIYKSEDRFSRALETLEGAYVFYTDDNDLACEINEIKDVISQNELELSGRAFETPIESRKVNEIKVDDSAINIEVYTETMFNLYMEQGEYDKAREVANNIYSDESQRNSAIEKLEKTKLNKMNSSAGFNPES